MAKGRGGLGRGLESLFEDAAPSFESDTRIETIPLRELAPAPGQPRKTFDDETLAENSALQYDRLAYGKKNRNVTLNGKAYFSVTHQEQCPFRVQTELANIQVLGTQFQVTANANQTSATVESGKVRFYNKEQKEAILTKGMYAFINQKGQMQIEKQSDPNTFAWKTHVFVYNEAPLKKVVKELEEVYKVHIGGIPQKEYYLTTTFDNTPIEDIIEIINLALDTKLDITQ